MINEFFVALEQNDASITHVLVVIKEDYTYILTSCHSVGYQEGGQSKRLQDCTRGGLGL